MTHPAARVDHRAARVARADQAAQRGDPPPHRAAPVGVLGDDRGRLAQPRRLDVVGAVLREAEHRGRSAGLGVHVEAQRRARRRRRARAESPGRCAGRTRSPGRPGAGPRRPPARSCRPGPPPRGRSSPRRRRPATQPEPCTPRPHAVPSTFTTLRPARAHVRIAGDRGVGRRHVAAAAARSLGNGSKRASA